MVRMVRAMCAFNMVTSQCGRQKVGLTCYAVRLTFWGQCLVVYAVRLAFEGGVSRWKRVPGRYLDGLLAGSVRWLVFDGLRGGERTHSHHQDGGGLGPPRAGIGSGAGMRWSDVV